MKSKRVLRYYCDHCKKSGCRKDAIQRHELVCIRNPGRNCFICERPTTAINLGDMIAVVEDGGDAKAILDVLRDLAEGCPACILAAIVQGRGPLRKITYDEDGAPSDEPNTWFDFNYKEEVIEYNREKYSPLGNFHE